MGAKGRGKRAGNIVLVFVPGGGLHRNTMTLDFHTAFVFLRVAVSYCQGRSVGRVQLKSAQ